MLKLAYRIGRPRWCNGKHVCPECRRSVVRFPVAARQSEMATSGEDEDVIVTGVSYADATRTKTQQSRDTNGTTYIGKNVRFSNNTSQNKQPNQKPKQYYMYPGQGRQYSPSYPNAPNPNLTNTQSRPPAQQGYNTYGQRPSPTERQSNNYVPNNYDRNPRQNQNLQSNDFLYPRSRQTRRR